MHSHTKETKEKKKKNKAIFPQRSICSILLEQQVATAGACLPVLAPLALRAAGCVARLSAGLTPLPGARGQRGTYRQGTHQLCRTKVLVTSLLPGEMIATLTGSKGGAGGGGRRNPQHGALRALPLVGGFERGLGTAIKSN